MNKHTRSKSGLFLMELTIVILFFAVTSAICMQIFSTAKVRSDESRDLSNAVTAAQSVAESYKSCNGDVETLAKALNGALDTHLSDKTVIFYYDASWQTVKDKDNAKFVMILTQLENSASKSKATINIFKVGGNSIYNLTVKTVRI